MRRRSATGGATGPRGAALGLDFGTESVRAVLVTVDGRELAACNAAYRHGQITRRLPAAPPGDEAEELPPAFALQHPTDWLASAARATRAAVRHARLDPADVIGVGVDFTSCTMLPARRDGTPLCLDPAFAPLPHAWPKLWKHHGAQAQADRLTATAARAGEPWLEHYGGSIGLEWFFPKVLEVIERAPLVARAADVWLEAGDWMVWRLVGGDATGLPRSTCQAGYKALWSRGAGYPSRAYFQSVHPGLADVLERKLPGRMVAPGECAGELQPQAARRLGLRAGTPVSGAIIDAHAAVPGVGVAEPGTMVLVMGTSGCQMLNARELRPVRGVAGIVEDGIIPGLVGYETGQAAVGDAFDWLRRLVGARSFQGLGAAAFRLPPGAAGVRCMDWLNGCRTPLMDGDLRGAFAGLGLEHGPAHLYRALLEASALGARWIVEVLEDGGVPVRRLVATGGLPHQSPDLVQIYADAIGRPIAIHPTTQGSAAGSAILGAVAAGARRGGFDSVRGATAAMAGRGLRSAAVVRPDAGRRRVYHRLADEHRRLAALVQAFHHDPHGAFRRESR
jgi:L-ribulokinase